MPPNVLPPDTARLWDLLQREPLLSGFVLVGGTGLALRIGHRVSEDLDFLYPHPRLPAKQLDALERKLGANGHELEPVDNPASYDEFLMAGMSLRDYQRDYLVDRTVKLSCFAGSPPPGIKPPPTDVGGPRVGELDEIFALKCLVAADRSKTRDWYDLYALMTEHGFALGDFARAYRAAGKPYAVDLALARLCSGRADPDDPGFETATGTAPSTDTLRGFFLSLRDQYERDCGSGLRPSEG